MKEVLLLRHAKSSWDSDTTRDFDRPLNGRGRRAAPLIGAYLAAHDLIPERIYCSAAARTRETLALMVDGWPQAPATRFDEGLYLASPDHMRATIRAADPEADRIMLIAHNPGLETLALHLADPDASDRVALRELSEKYPTGGLADFAFDVSDWADVAPRTGKLRRFIAPRRLADDT